MSDASFSRHISRAARRFAGANQGNIAVIFAFALLPIVSFVGAAIDYSRANSARSSMQAALDSTALMLSKNLSDGKITASDITTKAREYFAALYTNKDAQSVGVSAIYTPSSGMGSTIEVKGSATVPTDFMKVVGFPTLDFGASSTSAWGNVRMRVAMALDNTGSMADDGKMPAMQTAAKSLVDQLSALSKNNGDVYISVVPFAKDVNLGNSSSNPTYQQPWIDWTEWAEANGTCSKNSYKTRTNCENNGKTWTPATVADRSKWNGCFTDRAQDFDTKNTIPAPSDPLTLFPAEQYSYCTSGSTPYLQPILPLSYDWTALKNSITAMQPTGNTNQSIGLAWAWMTLGAGAPFNAPAKDPNYTYKDAIILLSDGLNTQNHWYSSASQIDARQKILCENAKAAGITIYTIQVNTHIPADPTSTVLQNCASSTDKFYVVTAASQTASVFNSIGSSLSKLRVAR